MMIDRIMADLKLGIADGTISEGAKSAIRDSAEAFLRAGGVVTWDLWVSMESETKAAFIHANELIQTEHSVLAALASFGPDQAAQILSAVDGGDMQIRLALKRTADQMMERMKREEVKA